MPKFDLDSIFGEIAGFLTFDIGNLFSINPSLKMPLFLPKLWDGQDKFMSNSSDELEDCVKPMKVCSVAAKIKREERRRGFKIRKSGYENDCVQVVRKDNIRQQANCAVGTNFCGSFSQPCVSHANDRGGCCDHRNNAMSQQHLCNGLNCQLTAEEEKKKREESLINRIRKCIEEQQYKLQQKNCGNIKWGQKQKVKCLENPPSAYYEQLRKNHSSDVVRCNPNVMPPPEKTNFFENLQDVYNKNNKRIKCPVEIADCGIQVRPQKTHKLVGTDDRTQCELNIKEKTKKVKKGKNKKPEKVAELQPAVVNEPNKMEGNITEFLRKCLAEEKQKNAGRCEEAAMHCDGNAKPKRKARANNQAAKLAKERQQIAKRIKRRESPTNIKGPVDCKKIRNRHRNLTDRMEYSQEQLQQPQQLQTPIGNRMIAVLHDKLNSIDVRKRREIIEQRARQVWQFFKLRDNAMEVDGADCDDTKWEHLKPYQKLAFSWAVIANQNVFDNPLDNFMDFYLNECTAGGKHQLTAAIVERGLELWDKMSKNDRLPFVMEAFIFLVSMGEVDMNNEAEIERVLNGLQ